MSIAKRFYTTLVDILMDTKELVPGASYRLQDRTISAYFDISESTARNWRRGRNAQISPSLASKIIDKCVDQNTPYIADLEFLTQLTSDLRELKLAAERLVSELLEYIVTDSSNWHVYSGPLKIAYNFSLNRSQYHRLLRQTAVLTERILELGLDREDIPCIGELVRYSSHGWFHLGHIGLREKALSNPLIGVQRANISTIEKALYYGDLCASTAYFLDDSSQARQYIAHSLKILKQAPSRPEPYAPMSQSDAEVIIRAIDVMQRCHDSDILENDVVFSEFKHDFSDYTIEVHYARAKYHEALGYIFLTHESDAMAAAYHFDLANQFAIQWLQGLQVPMDGVLEPSLNGYAMLKADGPSSEVKALMMTGLIQITDFDIITAQIPARLALSSYFQAIDETIKADHQREIAQNIAAQINLNGYFTKCQHIFV